MNPNYFPRDPQKPKSDQGFNGNGSNPNQPSNMNHQGMPHHTNPHSLPSSAAVSIPQASRPNPMGMNMNLNPMFGFPQARPPQLAHPNNNGPMMMQGHHMSRPPLAAPMVQTVVKPPASVDMDKKNDSDDVDMKDMSKPESVPMKPEAPVVETPVTETYKEAPKPVPPTDSEPIQEKDPKPVEGKESMDVDKVDKVSPTVTGAAPVENKPISAAQAALLAVQEFQNQKKPAPAPAQPAPTDSPSKEDAKIVEKTAEEATKPPQDNIVQERVQSPAVQKPSATEEAPAKPPSEPKFTQASPQAPSQARQPQVAQTAGAPSEMPAPAAAPAGDFVMRELKVEDALNYLDKVKLEFGDRPRIYNEFLEIMKNFKAHEIDTPGVIMRVSDLFRGYNNLILGFNTFLPDGFKISIKDLVEGGRYASKKPLPPGAMNHNMKQQMGRGHPQHQPFHPNAPQMNQQPQDNRGQWNNMQGRMGGNEGMGQGMQVQHQQAQSQPQQQAPPPPSQHEQQNNQQQGGGQEENPAIEFDHAISYVTTIKKRFSNEPKTYQQFLEILHTYQKEQRGIKEVLEQVSTLFADHPDLLKQFTYFLPEAVQEQAKERLHAAAAEAEARQASQRKRAQVSIRRDERGDDQEVTIDMTKKHAEKQQSIGKKRPSSPSATLQYPMMPETMIYNAGVERQFFDLAKESLRASSREGDLAWAEFLKCMDLYAQEILSKNDMLRYMEDLLGKHHADLFEEFKRILSAAGAAGVPNHDDAWHSVPLSEIDFSRCRRCTPSYRALPRDYPAAPYSGRSEEETKMLNDIWISLPDGSEESYTFRHMRKNQHEEVLFRCEDERFEIDMVIDSTATCLKRLEPIAEEIAMLQEQESFSEGYDSKEKMDIKSALDKGGMGGKVIKYSFDKSILNTIHRHAITRIYGDAGQEMLDLMSKNPVVAVPVVVKRLMQKLRDFKAAREVLNQRWKELAEINYYKSIDHRCLTWRTVDKRATSTRTLVSEIKDRAANNGYESEVTVLAKRDKAKEEFGSFYERTMGQFLERKMDLTNFPKPTPSMFTPHFSMQYENNSFAQRDAYRILSFALERGSISPGDKEKCQRLWTDFLAQFFDLGSIWMQSPAVSYAALPHHAPSIVSNDEESGNDDDESSAEEENDMVGDMMVTEEEMKETSSSKDKHAEFTLLSDQPIPSGCAVSTVYGEGVVTGYRSLDTSFIVTLPFGATAYLNRKAILCTVLPVDTFEELEHTIETDEEPLERDDDKFVLGPQSLYLFFRLHQVLIRRLNIAKKLAYSVDNDQSLSTLIEKIEPDGSSPIGQKRYEAYLSLVYGLLDGGFNNSGVGPSNAAEGGKYEDRVRCLLGHNAYELATMDKLISHILKHMQNLANDDTMTGMVQIFKKQLSTGGFKPMAFKQDASMVSDGENVFAFQYCHIPKSDNSIMHVELIGCITEDDDDDSMVSFQESEPATKKVKR